MKKKKNFLLDLVVVLLLLARCNLSSFRAHAVTSSTVDDITSPSSRARFLVIRSFH